MLGDRKSQVAQGLAANLNGAANAVLLTFVASKPIEIQRFGVIANAAAGLLAPSVLKLRITPITTGTIADLGTDLLQSVVRARGLGVYKDLTVRQRINAGDTVTVTVSVAAGGVSTGDVFLEYWELPFAGTEIAAFVAST